jgi:hypothetical protein
MQEKINKLKPYLSEIKFENDSTAIILKLPTKWSVVKSKVIGVEHMGGGTYVFYTSETEIGLDDLVDFCQEIIKINLEREQKIKLLSIKYEELKDIFNNNDLNVLEGLEFKLPEVNLNLDLGLSDTSEKNKGVIEPETDDEVVES